MNYEAEDAWEIRAQYLAHMREAQGIAAECIWWSIRNFARPDFLVNVHSAGARFFTLELPQPFRGAQ